MNYIQRAKKFRTKKRLGQNFLIDESILDSIVDYANININDTIIEIGPGIGFLTEKLVKKARNVIAIELDQDAIYHLDKINANNLKIIHNDILKTDISSLSKDKVKVVANIPYYITSPILVHLLGEIDDLNNKNRNSIESIILMVQLEVAYRMIANEKSVVSKRYGLLSVLSQFYCDVELLKVVKSRSFYPAPKVDSALVKLKVRPKPCLELTDYKFFKKILKALFATRRKNIRNCLIQAGLNSSNVDSALNFCNLDKNLRAENLSLSSIAKISETLLS